MDALTTEAVVGRRRYERPDCGILLNFGQLRTIAVNRSVAPFANGIQVLCQCVGGGLSGHGVEPLHAKIIGTAFEQSRRNRSADRFGH